MVQRDQESGVTLPLSYYWSIQTLSPVQISNCLIFGRDYIIYKIWTYKPNKWLQKAEKLLLYFSRSMALLVAATLVWCISIVGGPSLTLSAPSSAHNRYASKPVSPRRQRPKMHLEGYSSNLSPFEWANRRTLATSRFPSDELHRCKIEMWFIPTFLVSMSMFSIRPVYANRPNTLGTRSNVDMMFPSCHGWVYGANPSVWKSSISRKGPSIGKFVLN